MYKILLADEEGVALESLRIIIDNKYSDACDIRLAANTEQLSEIFPKFLPDIAFINVQMAGVHGIATFRELHAIQSNCLFIVVSYNQKIHFGREGMHMGIRSYATKPLKSELILSLLPKCFSMLDSTNKRIELEKFHREQWDLVIPMMESGMISELLFSDSDDNNLSVYKSLLNIEQNYGWMINLKYSQINENGTMCNPIGSVIQLHSQNIHFRKIVKAFFPSAIIGPILANQIWIMVPCQNPEYSEEEKRIREKRIHDMAYQLHKNLHLYFRYNIENIRSI